MHSQRHPDTFPKAATLLAAMILFLSLPGPSAAATPASGNVGEAAPATEWQGATFTAATNVGNAQGCFDAFGNPAAAMTAGPTACDVYTLTVDLDPAFWQDKTGGVRVQIDGTEDVDLYIYRRNANGTRGPLVADSATSSGSESALIEDASGGYYVVTVPYTVVSSGYRGSTVLQSNSQSGGLLSYLHDVSEPIPGVTVENSILEHYRIPAADGTLLDTWLLRPNIPSVVPVILEVTPYYGGGSPMDPTNLLAGNFQNVAGIFVPRGYAVAISSVRGTGNSEGCFSMGGPEEARDSAAVIRYLAHQSWANGKVGMMGVSYPGTTPQDVWVEAPAELKTIVPISGISDLYKYNFVNGVHINAQGYAFNTYYWGMVGLSPVGLNGGDQLRDPVSVPGAVIGEVCPEQVWVQEGGASSAVDGNKDGYWQLRDFLAELRASTSRPRASVFYIHGLQDWNVKPHMMEDWLPELISDVPYQIWLGQWGHAYPDREDWWTVLTAWFDKFLKGKSTGILSAPRVQVKDDDGRWRHESIWPPQNPAKLTLRPRQDGTLASQAAPGAASYYDYNGVLPPLGLQPLGPDRVVFVSEPLTEDLHISGLPRFEGDVTASGDRASLILTLAERTPQGDRAINYAAISLNHVQSLAEGRLSVAGLKQRVGVNFFPQSDVIHAGNRIVLIAAGNTVSGGQPGPGLQPVASGSEITLDLGDAKLILPFDTTLTYEQ
ncbi:MAG TPA: CocE/NonD family hydrolase [Thermoanaerobaculia bacterium]